MISLSQPAWQFSRRRQSAIRMSFRRCLYVSCLSPLLVMSLVRGYHHHVPLGASRHRATPPLSRYIPPNHHHHNNNNHYGVTKGQARHRGHLYFSSLSLSSSSDGGSPQSEEKHVETTLFVECGTIHENSYHSRHANTLEKEMPHYLSFWIRCLSLPHSHRLWGGCPWTKPNQGSRYVRRSCSVVVVIVMISHRLLFLVMRCSPCVSKCH